MLLLRIVLIISLCSNLAPVHAGPRQLRTMYLPPFERACIETGALSIMTAYSSRDGVPVVADKGM